MRGHSPLNIVLPCCPHFSALALLSTANPGIQESWSEGRGVHRVINLGPTPTVCLASGNRWEGRILAWYVREPCLSVEVLAAHVPRRAGPRTQGRCLCLCQGGG